MRQMMKLAALAAMLALGTQAAADDGRAARAEAQMAETIERLGLTDAQIEQVRPILEESAEARQQIMSKYGVDPENREGGARLGMRKARAMRKELVEVQKETDRELEKILNAEQLKELEVIRQQRRDQMRERLRGG